MAPAAKKGSATKQAHSRDRHSSSRHSTPLTESSVPPSPVTSTPTTHQAPQAPPLPKETPYLHTLTSAIISNDDASIESYVAAVSRSKNGDPPSAKDLHVLHDNIRGGVTKLMARRSELCDRSMRQLAQRRKASQAAERERAAEAEIHRRLEEEREKKRAKKVKSGKIGADDEQRMSKKRNHEETEAVASDEQARDRERRDSLPSVGAHGVARQDGVGVHQGQVAPLSPKIEPGTVTVDPMDIADSPSDSDSSADDPVSSIPLYERAFGTDPTKFDDPTVYDVRPWTDDMEYEDKKAIFNVKFWPESDLKDLTAGEPPDQDFSNAKPANQVNFTTFQTYVEPFIRPYTEEDVSYLKERGDRFTPYVIPSRGARTYKETWAAEDGLDDGTAPPRGSERRTDEPRGGMDDMDDAVAETDEVSMGPVMNRLLSMLRPSAYANGLKREEKDEEGDTSMLTVDMDNAEALLNGTTNVDAKPASCLPADAPRPDTFSIFDYETFDQRALQELRHIGFLTPDEAPDYKGHNDDEVAGRLRTLQHELRRVSTLNNIRKSRILELTEERMAMQEYSNIADDLDNQVNAAYLKRNRSLAKPSNKKHSAKPGQKGLAISGGGTGGRTVSDGVKALMQKRLDWIDMVGPVVAYGRPHILGDGETVFDEASMRKWQRVEREAESAEVEGE